jgi:ATP-dependent Clp protease ATP-binding subunit ClpC
MEFERFTPMARFERFTRMARRVVVIAQESARHRRQQHIGTDDLLLALMLPSGASSSQALERLGVRRSDISNKLKRRGWRSSPRWIPMTTDTKRALEAAFREADNRGEVHVGSAHLLLALVAEPLGDGSRMLSDLGLSYSAVWAALEALPEPESLREGAGADTVLSNLTDIQAVLAAIFRGNE